MQKLKIKTNKKKHTVDIESPTENQRYCATCKRPLTSADDSTLCITCKSTVGSAGATVLAVAVGTAVKFRKPLVKLLKTGGKIAVNFFKNIF